ncbi:hypothetical protein ABGB09_34225 [Streptomyces sp. B8F3]|uniref:hypothetical protein n=1 Tax=Streptomyces sp. B8F3 TaxID=3153573 RepID=UPI00325EE8FF
MLNPRLLQQPGKEVDGGDDEQHGAGRKPGGEPPLVFAGAWAVFLVGAGRGFAASAGLAWAKDVLPCAPLLIVTAVLALLA